MIAEESDRIARRFMRCGKHWPRSAQFPTDQLDDLRAAIIKRVEARRQFVMVQNYRKALARRSRAKPSWYERWWPVASSSDDQPIDDTVEVAEEAESHVILPAINGDAYATLRGRRRIAGPGAVGGAEAVLSVRRCACHVIGTLAMAGAKPDPEAANELRKYWPNDTAGSSALRRSVSLCLRGTRGEQTAQRRRPVGRCR